MTLMRKFLSKVGFGEVVVDTILDRDNLVAGEEIKGIVKVKGASIKQTVDGIYLTLSTRFTRQVKAIDIHTRYDLHRVKVVGKFALKAKELKEIPFSFVVPHDTPITLDDGLVWVHTNLDIKCKDNPEDIDYIKVNPDKITEKVIADVESIGFVLDSIELKERPEQKNIRLPFVQEVTFKPTQEYSHKLDNLKIISLCKEEYQVEVSYIDQPMKKLTISNCNEQCIQSEISKLLED